MTFDRIAVVGAGAWGTALANVDRARRPQRDAVGARCRPPPSDRAAAAKARACPACSSTTAIAVDAATRRRGAPPMRSCWRCRRRRCARSRTALAPALAPGTPVDRLRQGHRARHAQVHDRGDRRMRAAARCPRSCPARASPPTWRAACRPRSRSPRATRRLAAALARRRSARATFRPYHSTDVRGVEIGGAAKNVLAIAAGIVGRPRARRQRRGGADHARLRRAGPLRPGVRRAAGDADGPVRPRRSHPHLLEPAVAQFLASASRSARATPADAARGGKLAEGAFTAPVLVEMASEQGRRHADRDRRRRRARRTASSVDEAIESAADAAVPAEG